MLDDLGLVPALLWHLGQFQQRTNVRVTLEHSGLERRLGPKIETASYRIIQEALTNIARHAGTQEASVQLWTNEQILYMQVEDQGRGFDVETTLASGASGGLIGMRERTTALGGLLSVVSTPGAGTCVSAELPIEEQRVLSEGDGI